MRVNNAQQIWQFDVDDTLIMWDLSKYPGKDYLVINTPKGNTTVLANKKNVNLLIKLAKVGWYIRVHSGSGADWAERVVRALGVETFVDEVCAKPRGESDDKPSGDGLAYRACRDPLTGCEF